MPDADEFGRPMARGWFSVSKRLACDDTVDGAVEASSTTVRKMLVEHPALPADLRVAAQAVTAAVDGSGSVRERRDAERRLDDALLPIDPALAVAATRVFREDAFGVDLRRPTRLRIENSGERLRDVATRILARWATNQAACGPAAEWARARQRGRTVAEFGVRADEMHERLVDDSRLATLAVIAIDGRPMPKRMPRDPRAKKERQPTATMTFDSFDAILA